MKKLFLLLLLYPATAFGTTYYTSTGGSGTTCTMGSPCTIGTGVGKLASGDTLMLNDGTYDYQIHTTQPPSGSMGAPTIIKAVNNRMAILKPTTVVGGGYGLIDIDNKAYITFDGIVQDAGSCSNCGNNDGFRLASDDHIIIQNAEIRNNNQGASLLDCGSSPNGVEVTLGDHTGTHGSTNDQFLNNYVHDNGYICTADGLGTGFGLYIQESDNIVNGNTINGNAGGGVQIRNGSGAAAAGLRNIVRKNTVDSNGRFAVVLSSFTSASQIQNNVLSNTNSGEGAGVDFYQNASSSFISNNTIFGSLHKCIFLDNSGGSTPSGNTLQNNICYMNSTAITDNGTGTTCSHNLNASGCGPTEGTSNPLFVNSGAGNFHLQALSPATAAGLDLSATFTTDFDGLIRTVPWDDGAFKQTAVPCMSPCVQMTTGANPGSGTTLAVAFPVNQTIGNTNVVGVTFCPDINCVASTSGGTCALTDDLGNTYTQDVVNLGPGTAEIMGCIFHVSSILAGANTVHVTAAVGGAAFYLRAYLTEFNGYIGITDRTGSATVTAATSITVSTSMATTNANDLVYALTTNINGGESVPSGYIALSSNQAVYKTVAATGVQSATWNMTMGDGLASIIAIKNAACTPDHLAFTVQPSSTLPGGPLGTVAVAVQNASNIICTGDTSTVTIANKGGTCTGMTLGGTKVGAAVSGIFATVDLTENVAGACTLHATDGALTAADSTPFTIFPVGHGLVLLGAGH